MTWNKNARTKQKQQTNENRAILLVYRTDANARGFWLVMWTLGWKKFTPENFPEINRYLALTSYCNTIGQSNNAFAGGKTKRLCFDLLIHWLIYQTSKEHLPKPFFTVIRKSLYVGFEIINGEPKQRLFWATHVKQKGLFADLSCDFEQNFGQIVSIRVKTLSNTNLVASTHIKREKKLTFAWRASLKKGAG